MVFVVAHERIETHIEQLGDARRIAEIGTASAASHFATVWRATPIFCASYSWVIPWRVLSESMF